MWNKFNVVILVAFFSILAPCAHAQLPVFGPELFVSETGIGRRVIKDFSVPDANQKFILFIQCGAQESRGAKATITLNGVRLALPAELSEHVMIAEPVKLRKENELSVEIGGKGDVPFFVTIMNMDEHIEAVEILPIGGEIGIEGHTEVIFPSGSFGATQGVAMTVAAVFSHQSLFEAGAMVPHLPYEIRINSGDQPPARDVEISVNVTDSLVASDYAMHIFARMHDNPDAPDQGAPDQHDRFFRINSGVDDILKAVKATLPRQAFSNRHGRNGTYEAIITVGLVH